MLLIIIMIFILFYFILNALSPKSQLDLIEPFEEEMVFFSENIFSESTQEFLKTMESLVDLFLVSNESVFINYLEELSDPEKIFSFWLFCLDQHPQFLNKISFRCLYLLLSHLDTLLNYNVVHLDIYDKFIDVSFRLSSVILYLKEKVTDLMEGEFLGQTLSDLYENEMSLSTVGLFWLIFYETYTPLTFFLLDNFNLDYVHSSISMFENNELDWSSLLLVLNRWNFLEVEVSSLGLVHFMRTVILDGTSDRDDESLNSDLFLNLTSFNIETEDEGEELLESQFCSFLEKGGSFHFDLLDEKWSSRFFKIIHSSSVKQTFIDLEDRICQYLEGTYEDELLFKNQDSWIYLLKPLSSNKVFNKINFLLNKEDLSPLENQRLKYILLFLNRLNEDVRNRLQKFFNHSQMNYSDLYHEHWRRVVMDCHFCQFYQNLFKNVISFSRFSYLKEIYVEDSRDYWDALVTLIVQSKDVFDSFKVYGGKTGGRGKNGYTILQEGYAFKLSLDSFKTSLKLLAYRSDFKREDEVGRYFDHPFVARIVAGHLSKNSYCYLFNQYPQEVEYSWVDKYILYRQGKMTEEEFQGYFRDIFIQLLFAMHYLHLNDITHGDIKGANMMLSKEGYLKLIDFGLSNTSSSEVSKNTTDFRSVSSLKKSQDILLGRFLLKLKSLKDSLDLVSDEEYQNLKTSHEISQFIFDIREKVTDTSSHSKSLQENARQSYLDSPEDYLGVWNIKELLDFVYFYKYYPIMNEDMTDDDFKELEITWWKAIMEPIVLDLNLESSIIQEVVNIYKELSFRKSRMSVSKSIPPMKAFFSEYLNRLRTSA